MRTLGHHIRKRRLDLGLIQRDLAERVGVSEDSIWNWENRGLKPELRYMPAILDFLGYDPRPEPATLAERIVRFREGKGWARPRLAVELCIDPSTLARWERGEKSPRGDYAKRVQKLMRRSDSPTR